MIKKLLFIFLFIVINVNAQSIGIWFPKELNIHPFTANMLEPRAGFSFFTGQGNLRLDIGTSEDFYHYKNGNEIISFGGDLFTWTRLRSTKEFHFPVEMVDYLFGLNGGYKKDFESYEIGARFRISHISAHLVDGKYNFAKQGWEDRLPRVYSREFFELIPYYKIKTFRAYIGLTYLFHSTPSYVGKGIYQAGLDYFINFMGLPAIPFFAYDFKLAKINKYTGSNAIMVGFKFGEFDKKGLSIYYAYNAGYSIHGELFDVFEKYSSFGLNIDF